ncbi:molybdate ABC transporter permease subunit [Macrococcoides caseolyticum]|uniref:molybdate ABC transporter permease subunit n=1 Tax=Macrococcoides caseolyticum TaxID=69966 RepID=UPI001F38F7AD|nr:molybdate ABC transporter permease subunit [Macrococcus caseolyticus]MCE4956509.1 molybdate ABC transporter permease subunit [Macrococcus caseolyticus]
MYELLTSENFISPIIISLKVATIATLLSLTFALILHYVIGYQSFPGKSTIESIIMLPMVLPPTVVGFILLISLGKHSIIGRFIEQVFHQPIIFTIYAAITASTIVALPLMYQSLKIGIEQVPQSLLNAAIMDGARKTQVYTQIILPLCRPAIMTGLLLSFARAIGEFGATLIFAGNIPGITETMPTAIYVAIDNNEMLLAWGWVAIMITLSFIMMMATQLLRK